MSTDHRMDAAVQHHGGLREAFASEARQQSHQPADTSLTATARAEIAAGERVDSALDKHDRDWERQRDALAGKPEEAPTLDYGVQPGRSIEAEYRDARMRWELHQDQILDEHHMERADIRARGQTLSDAFQAAGTRMGGSPTATLSDAFHHAGNSSDDRRRLDGPAPEEPTHSAETGMPETSAGLTEGVAMPAPSRGRSL